MSTKAQASIWRQLKSMQHAIDRSLDNSTNRPALGKLDRERLLALEKLLLTGCEAERYGSLGLYSANELYTAFERPHIQSDIDLHSQLASLKSFEDYNKANNYELSVNSLIAAVGDFCKRLKDSDGLVPEEPPRAEFIVLKDMLLRLLKETESRL